MTFDTIIKEAGFNSCKFPKASLIPITLYDGKERELEKVHYAEELFADNVMSAVNFFSFLNFLETKPVSSMNIKIDQFSVIIFYHTPQAVVFKRSSSMEPIDYMD